MATIIDAMKMAATAMDVEPDREMALDAKWLDALDTLFLSVTCFLFPCFRVNGSPSPSYFTGSAKYIVSLRSVANEKSTSLE